jgi:hypothetical protein
MTNMTRDWFERSYLFDSLSFQFPRRPTVHILVVVDTAISLHQSDNFGVSRIVRLLRAGTNYAHFEVTLATRPASPGEPHTDHGAIDPVPAPETARYTGFRFDGVRLDGHAVLNGVDEVWCYGFDPGNDGSTDDAHVAAAASASTDAELHVLAAWQNAGGSMLAMGDHHYLGASLCSRMLRVGTMRRWTNADGVPTLTGFTRIDTNQPMNHNQEPVSAGGLGGEIPFEAQSDAVPQPLSVRLFGTHTFPTPKFYPLRPHPLLCGGRLGLIDVYPDHPHEGRVREDAEVDTTRHWTVDPSIAEYPTIGGHHPRPQVIAWGHTTAQPPYNHDKGPEQSLRFPVLGVYDGDPIGAGRIVVDSTWHHWFDINLDGVDGVSGFEHAADQTVWNKLVAFYHNVAVWLARPAQRAAMLNYVAFWATFQPTLFEELTPAVDSSTLGKTGLSALERLIPSCMLRSWIWDHLRDLELVRERFPPIPWPCLSCPPIDLLEELGLGELFKLYLPVRDALLAARRRGDEKHPPSIPEPEHAIAHLRAAASRHYTAWLEGELESLRKVAAHAKDIATRCEAARPTK